MGADCSGRRQSLDKDCDKKTVANNHRATRSVLWSIGSPRTASRSVLCATFPPYAKKHTILSAPPRSVLAHAAGAAVRGHGRHAVHGHSPRLWPVAAARSPKTWAGRRESFSLAIAVQNLSWGVFGIFVGMLGRPLGRVQGADGWRRAVRAWGWRAWPCRPPPGCLP